MTKLNKAMLLLVSVFMLFTFGLNSIKPSAISNNVVQVSNNTMNLRLDRGKAVIEFTDNFSKINSFIIDDYSIYGVLNNEGQVRYYIADIFENEEYIEGKTTSKVLKLMILNKDELVFSKSKPMVLEITYYNNLDNQIFTIEKKLEISDFSLLTRYASMIKLSDDEVSDRLRASMNAESSFKAHDLESFNLNKEGFNSIKTMSVLQSSTLYSNSNASVNAYNHDNLTNDDAWIDAYLRPEFFNGNIVNGIITDDYITRIVPKFLLFKPGVHSYVGKEYGFSIKVTLQSTNLYVADIFIYDIEVTIPGMISATRDEASVEVKPLYQFRYFARQKGAMTSTEWNKKYDSSLIDVIYKHTNYDAPNYYLKDVQIKLTTANTSINKNPGDTGYNINNDYGDNAQSQKFYYNGEGKTTGRNTYNLNNFNIGYEKHYSYSSKINDPNLSGNVVLTHSNKFLFRSEVPSHDVSNKMFTNNTGMNRENSIYYYNTIFRSTVFHIRSSYVLNNQDPLLIGTRTANNYLKAVQTYELRDYTLIHENQFHVSIAADFVSDDTYYQLIFYPKGQITVLDTTEGSYYYGSYHRRPSKIDIYTENIRNFTIPEGGTIYFTVSSIDHAKYTIETLGLADTVMEIYDGKTGKLLKISDDDGSYLNGKYEFVANKFDSYLIKVRLYNRYISGNTTIRLNFRPSITLNVEPAFVYFNTYEELTIIQVHIPEESYYRFHTVGNFNTSLGIYTTDSILIKGNNQADSIGKNGLVDVYLEEGYYYAVIGDGEFTGPKTNMGFTYYNLWA